MIVSAAKNIGHLFTLRAQINPTKTAYLRKRNGQWVAQSWKNFEDQVFEIARALKERGVVAGDRVALLSQSRPEWTLVDLAVLSLGAVTVPIYQSVTADEAFYILQDSASKVLFVEDTSQRKKIYPLLERLPELKILVSLEGTDESPFQSLKSFSSPSGIWPIEEWRGGTEIANPTDLATVVYTSGTTGSPKGVKLNHKCFLTMIDDVKECFDIGEKDSTLLFLPLAHIMGRIEQMLFIGVGWTTAYAEGAASLIDDMGEVRPTILFSVPRIYEKFYATLRAKFTQKPASRVLFEQALRVGRKMSLSLQMKKKPGPLLKMQYNIFDRLVFSKIRAKFGNEIRFTISGGAPLSVEIAEFFHACGILVLEGYGLTETTGPVVVNRVNDFRFGTVGKTFPSAQIKIAADGEILIKGDSVFQGYNGAPLPGDDSLQSDYFASGDIGQLDVDGFLRVTDRKKDLIITSGGKNIAPQKIENVMKGDPLFSNAVVFGDREKYLVMLLCLNPSEVKRYFQKMNSNYTSFEDALHDSKFEKFVRARVDSVNSKLASYEKIKKFKILPRELSLEAGELTPSLKVKRKFCAQKYSNLIKQMYEAPRNDS